MPDFKGPGPLGPSMLALGVALATPAYAQDTTLQLYEALRTSYIESSESLVKDYRASSDAEAIKSIEKDAECIAKAFDFDATSTSATLDSLLFDEEESLDPLAQLLAEREGKSKPSTTSYTFSTELYDFSAEDELTKSLTESYISCDKHQENRGLYLKLQIDINRSRDELIANGQWDAEAQAKDERKLHSAMTTLESTMGAYSGCQIEKKCP